MRGILLAVMAVALSGLVGCASKPRPISFDVRVQLDPAWKAQEKLNGTVDVNLIAVKLSDDAAWRATDVDRWWREDSQRREYVNQGVLHTMTFRDNDRDAKTLRRNEKIWDTWIKDNGSHILYVIANPPFAEPGVAGNTRLLRLPLYQKSYEDGANRELRITVYRNRIDLENNEVADKK